MLLVGGFCLVRVRGGRAGAGGVGLGGAVVRHVPRAAIPQRLDRAGGLDSGVRGGGAQGVAAECGEVEKRGKSIAHGFPSGPGRVTDTVFSGIRQPLVRWRWMRRGWSGIGVILDHEPTRSIIKPRLCG